jgi:hypothetical protein
MFVRQKMTTALFYITFLLVLLNIFTTTAGSKPDNDAQSEEEAKSSRMTPLSTPPSFPPSPHSHHLLQKQQHDIFFRHRRHPIIKTSPQTPIGADLVVKIQSSSRLAKVVDMSTNNNNSSGHSGSHSSQQQQQISYHRLLPPQTEAEELLLLLLQNGGGGSPSHLPLPQRSQQYWWYQQQQMVSGCGDLSSTTSVAPATVVVLKAEWAQSLIFSLDVGTPGTTAIV